MLETIETDVNFSASDPLLRLAPAAWEEAEAGAASLTLVDSASGEGPSVFDADFGVSASVDVGIKSTIVYVEDLRA